MQKINLIPTRSGSGTSGKLTGRLSSLNSFFLVIFIISVAAYVIVTLKSKDDMSKELVLQNNLKSSITALQETENQIVFLRNRINLARSAIDSTPVNINPKKLLTLVSSFPADTQITQFDNTLASADFVINTPNQEVVKSFVDSLKKDENYKNIFIKSITYNVLTGYSITISLSE